MLTKPPVFRTLIPVLTAMLLLLSGCDGDNTIWEPRGSSLVTLSFEDLKPLEGGLSYQAWVIESKINGYWGSPLGIFNIDESGQIVDPSTGSVLSGTFEAGLDAGDVFAVQVTVEMSDTLVSQPSATFILGGTVVGATAALSQGSWLSMAVEFSGMSGRYFLATPSDDLEDNELSGVWFADLDSGTPAQGLLLPQAPDGWDYEAWVVIGDDTLSTGKFYQSTGADTTNTFGGITGNYEFPGQDFLMDAPEGMTFPLDLSGSPIFITLEPWEEYDVEPLSPFNVRLLEATIPADAVAGTTYDMTSLLGVMPRGTATVQQP